MPDYPYIYAEGPPRPVEPGGTRLRVYRRRPQREGENREEASAREEERESVWRELLEKAVAELNDVFRRSGAPHSCQLQEDESGFVLRVTTPPGGPEGAGEVEVEEALDPADLPAWLARLRAHLGIFVDERI